MSTPTNSTSADSLLLDGIGIGGYRSFPNLTYFGPLGKVTLLAGRNNAGKSNVIRFLDKNSRDLAPVRDWHDQPRSGTEQLSLSIAHRIARTSPDWTLLHPDLRPTDRNLNALFDLPAFHPTNDPDLVWLTYTQGSQRSGEPPRGPVPRMGDQRRLRRGGRISGHTGSRRRPKSDHAPHRARRCRQSIPT